MAKTIHYKKGAVLFFEGERPKYVFMLREGEIDISKFEHESKKSVFKAVGSGFFFGVKNRLTNMPYMCTAIAAMDSVVTLLSKAEFDEFILGQNKVMLEVIRGFSQQLKETHDKLYAKYYWPPEKNSERGMFSVARAFFDMKEYLQCADVCGKFLEVNGDSKLKPKIEELLEEIDRAKKLAAEKLEAQKNGQAAASDVGAATSVADVADSVPQDEQPPVPLIFSDDEKLEVPIPEAFRRYEKSFPARKVIFSEFEKDDSFFMVVSGFVRSAKYINGVNVNISLAKPGDFFGLNYFVDLDTRDVSTIATNDVRVLEFGSRDFETLIAGNPKISLLLMNILAKRVYLDRKILRNTYITDLQLRLKDMFAVLDENGLCEKVGRNSRKVNLTAANISVWTNASRETIQKELDLLEAQELIRQSDEGWILVKDIKKMQNISCGIKGV